MMSVLGDNYLNRFVTKRTVILRRMNAHAERHVLAVFADQLLTNFPSRSSASGNLSVIAAKPRRKCGGASKQSPGASRMPCSAAAWQKARLSSPLTSQGNAVIQPQGGIQPIVS